jgi:hypothetical protein
MIATEGFDVPNVSCVLLLRPTTSWALFAQMVGRGLRLHPGKTDCLVIDVVGAAAGHSLASAPGLLGLPESYKGSGESLTAVRRMIDGLSPAQAALLNGRRFDLSSVDSVLREVDLLSELKVPDAIQKISRMAWRPRLSGGWSLGCGSVSRDSKAQREAVIQVNALGQADIRLLEGSEVLAQEVYNCDEMEAITKADMMIGEAWPEASRITAADAPWRQKTASPKQVELLVKKGMPPSRAQGLTMDQASAAIDIMKQNKWRLPEELKREVEA